MTNGKSEKNGAQDAYISIHEKRIETMEKDIKTILQAIAMLKVQAGVWGLVGGLLPAIGILLIIFIKNYV